MFVERLMCLFKGHKWSFWGLYYKGDVAQYEKCQRCGLLRGDGDKTINEWFAED